MAFIGLFVMVTSLVVYWTQVASAATFTVTNTADSGAGSLRQALIGTNASSNLDTINFNVPGGPYQTISVFSELTITQPVIIDGTSQPGFSGSPVIEINGAGAGAGTSGIHITGGGSTIKGLIVNRFGGDGIILTNNGSNTIQGNYVGTNSAGTSGYGNGASGIGLQTSNNTIGGTSAAQRNVVSGNAGTGIAVTGSSASNNTISGNYVGTNASGNGAIGNGADGILLTNAPNNTVGGTSGTTPNGPCTGACNLSSGNGANGIGIWQSPATGNTVVGNYAGVDVNGTGALPNGDIGFEAQDAPGNTIGGTTPAERNIFSGNYGAGVSLTGSASSNNTVQGNYIGVDVTGQTGIGNHKMGVNIGSPDGGSSNAHNNLIGGTSGTSPGGSCTGACNVISGNAWNGIYITGSNGGSNQMIGNFIGSSASGGNAIGNVLDGIGILSSPYNIVGGSLVNQRNIISANGGNGVVVIGGASGSNLIEGNYIGLATNAGAMPNQANGVSLAGGIQTAVLQNNIDSNRYLGIDIGGNGPSANDGGDSDGGPNGTQNYPSVAFAIPYGGGENIVGSLNSLGNTSFRIEFFSSPGCDSSGYGEGHNYLGATTVNTNASGNASFNVLTSTVPGGFAITTTASRMSGGTPVETSEFSHCAFTPRPHPDGTLIRPAGSNNIFLSHDGGNGPLGSAGVLASYNISSSEFKTATTADTAKPAASGLYFREGTVLKGSGPNIYIIDQTSATTWGKRLVTNGPAFNALGYTAADVIQVADSDLSGAPNGPVINDSSRHPDGTIVKSPGGTLYLLQDDTKRFIGSPEVFVSQRYQPYMIKNATSADLALPDGNYTYFREGTMIKGSGPTIYIIDDTGSGFVRRAIASPSAFAELGYNLSDVLTVPDSALQITDGEGV